MLKPFYENESEIPEALRECYVAKDGRFVLNIEGHGATDIDALSGVLDKERKARREAEKIAKELKDRFGLLPDDFDLDEYNTLKDSHQGEIDAKLKEQRERLTKQHQKELAARDARISELDSLVSKHVTDASLTNAMDAAGIGPQFKDAVKAMFKDKVTIEAGEVFLDEKPVSDALKEWASTDAGKHFVSAKPNSGSGAGNAQPGNGAAGKTMSRQEYDALPYDQQAAIINTGVQLTD